MQNQPNICPQCKAPIPDDAPGGLCPACVLLGVAGRTNPSQAAAASAPTMEEVAAAFPELEVLDILGQGGMGIVFKARQPRLDRFVALKVLPPALAAQPGFAERFTREARVLARLAHQNIVSIYDFGESAGFFYLIMEFVNGVNLRAAMRAGVTPEQALLLVPRICEALQFAHDHGVLHRDIKPENILLDTAGVPKLADFGIAKLAGDESGKTGLTATGAALGTAVYMAPEQIEKPATVDHRADIYSLGVVLYEMLTGELPLGRFAAPSEKSSVDRGVDEVVMRALEKERERRQQSATEMKTEVEGASHGGGGGDARAAAPAAVAGAPQNDLIPRILRALCALSAVGIPLTGMIGWDVPAPRHMVVLLIFFGTLAALSKNFVPELNNLVKFRLPADPNPRDPSGHGRTIAFAGLGLMTAPLVLLLLSLPWFPEFADHHHVIALAVGVPFALAGLCGLGATFTALLYFRFRARWFFFASVAAALATMFAFDRGHGVGFPGLLGLGVIGYCIFYFREFFPARDASRTTNSLPDPAPNPWPHRLFWLVVTALGMPLVLALCALVIPQLSKTHRGLTLLATPFGVGVSLLPYLAAGAILYGFFRTKPGADQAAPRATWNPWPKRIFILLLAIFVIPLTLVGIGIAVPMISYRAAQRPAPVIGVAAARSNRPARNAPTAMPAPLAIGAAPAAPQPLVPGMAPSPMIPGSTFPLPSPAVMSGAPTPGGAGGTPANIARLQDEKIRLAREQYNMVKANVEKAVAPRSELAAAERDLALAEARDDEVSIATALVAYAEYQNKMLQAAAQAQTVSRETVRAAEQELNSARLRLGKARDAADVLPQIHAGPKTGSGAGPAPGFAATPAAMPPTQVGNPAIARLQDENIRTAREQLDTTKKRVEAGVAAPIELAAAERNLAVAEARDDELKAATALVTYAEARCKILREQVKAGTATSLEGLDAEQELNTARLRLEKARSAAGIELPHDAPPKAPGTAVPEIAPDVEKPAPAKP